MGWRCVHVAVSGGASKLITTTMSIAAEGKQGEGAVGVKSELNTCAETSGGRAGRETDGSVGPAASVRIHTAAAMLRGGDGEPSSGRCCFRWVSGGGDY